MGKIYLLPSLEDEYTRLPLCKMVKDLPESKKRDYKKDYNKALVEYQASLIHPDHKKEAAARIQEDKPRVVIIPFDATKYNDKEYRALVDESLSMAKGFKTILAIYNELPFCGRSLYPEYREVTQVVAETIGKSCAMAIALTSHLDREIVY